MRAEKWNEGDNRERSDNQRSVRQAKQEEGSKSEQKHKVCPPFLAGETHA